jgi:hypothetical protein
MLSNLKLRAGWGIVGNQEIGDESSYGVYATNYGALSGGRRNIGSAYDIYGVNGGTLLSGYTQVRRGNPDLKWESTTEKNIGADFGFLNEKIFGSFDLFNRRTTDILVTPPYVATIGAGASQVQNGATVDNKGFEFTFGYRDNTQSGLAYSIGFNVGAFRDQVMNNITRFKWVPKTNATEVVFKALQPAIRFTKEECLDLPDMMYVTRDVPLTAQQSKYYEKMLKDQLMVAAGEEISAPTAAANLNKLLQISGGAVYTDNRDTIEFDCSDRLQALKEVVEEASHKVLVFVPYTHSLLMVSEWLKKQGYVTEVINGAVSPNKRTEIFNRFQTTPNPQVLVIQPQAASHGVTLHAANVVVYWSPVMSVETYLQANARVHRAGQVNKVTIVHLQGSRVERKMYQMLQNKVDTHQRLVDLYKEELGEVNE